MAHKASPDKFIPSTAIRPKWRSGGILRDVDLTLVGSHDETGASRLGQWVLVHVGFAMSVINEEEARDTLNARYRICSMSSRTWAPCCMGRNVNTCVTFDEYRAPEQVLQLIDRLSTRASLLDYTKEKPLRIMEVCGGHTHAIFKFGLYQLLPENIEFIHGPGCPVCVLPMGASTAVSTSPAAPV